ncbi:MAG: right-handed parallel beta-helix repeat-containing protein, partial [Povalibacter sp.]
WLNINTLDDYRPLRATTDNKAIGNWYSQGKVRGSWDEYNNNLEKGNQLVKNHAWPEAAKKIISNAGIQADIGAVAYGDAH